VCGLLRAWFVEDPPSARPPEDPTGSVVDFGADLVQLRLVKVYEARSFWQIFANTPIEVLVGAALPSSVRISEICQNADRVGEPVMPGEF
jgi:hypothetical protein